MVVKKPQFVVRTYMDEAHTGHCGVCIQDVSLCRDAVHLPCALRHGIMLLHAMVQCGTPAGLEKGRNKAFFWKIFVNESDSYISKLQAGFGSSADAYIRVQVLMNKTGNSAGQ
ncbi:hypothetical protein CEE39_00005 [bacterium (candidate division B38) B3_B38]|nr:MAG: hypothetical protein CEE39_00005 [bacterium (candidate division B38) B3_B38]